MEILIHEGAYIMKNNWKTKDLAKMALFISLLSISAVITFPFGPIPFTMQTMIINLIALLLSPFQAFMTILGYLLLGATGLPVFSGATGGIGKLFGPTGGFLFGFLAAAPMVSFVFQSGLFTGSHKFLKMKKEETKKSTSAVVIRAALCLIFIGSPIIYGLGSFYMMFLTGMSFSETLFVAIVPFLLPDLFKLVLSLLLLLPLRRVFFSFEK